MVSFTVSFFFFLLIILFPSTPDGLLLLFIPQHLPIYWLSCWHRHSLVFHSIWPLSSISLLCTNLFFHQQTTHLFIHILFLHLSNLYSIYILMHFHHITVPIYLFKPSIFPLPVNPSTKYPPTSLWKTYLFTKPLQGNENLCCYCFILQGRLYLVILKHGS